MEVSRWAVLAARDSTRRLRHCDEFASQASETLYLQFFSPPPFLFSFKAFSGNCEKSLATARARATKTKMKTVPFCRLYLYFFESTSFSDAASLMILRRVSSLLPFLTILVGTSAANKEVSGHLVILVWPSHGGIDIFSPWEPQNSTARVFTTT